MTTAARDPRARPNCPDCHGDGLQVGRGGATAATTPCACVGPCADCAGSGFVRGPAGLARCACAESDRRARILDAACLPARHAESTLASFLDRKPHQTAVKQAVAAYLRDADARVREGRGLVLYGDVGRGKTHLITALCRDLALRKGLSVRFVEFSHLIADLKAGFDQGVSAARLLDPLVRIDVLAVDELGKGRAQPTPFEEMIVDELVSRRYADVRPILATTNYGLAPATASLSAAAARALADQPVTWPPLVERVGERVVSRLRETCEFLEVKGDDWRHETAPRPAPPAARARPPG
jgi:DNA replication protein DnaC